MLTCINSNWVTRVYTRLKPIHIEYLFEINKRFCLTNMLRHSLIVRSSAAISLGGSLVSFSWKVSVSNLEEARDGLMLDLPHQA